MLFQSYIFILLFFPLCLLGFWGLKRQKLLQLWLIAFSLWFYGAASPYYLLLLLGSIAWNYAFFRAIERGIGRVTERVSGSAMERAEYGMERDSSRKKLLLGIGIAGNLALLCFFKYFNAISAGWSQMKGLEDPILQLALPLGISFFTFQQIGFLADAYKGEVGACSLREYVLFVSFFPYVSSGPIVNAQEMLPQYRQIGRQRLDWAKFSGGLYLFALGLSKKVLLADTFGKAVDAGYGNVAGLSGTDAWLVMLFYTLQLYFDFSGYCDMAVGLGKMIGLEVAENFDAPFHSASVKEFWRRWHMTLGRFFTRYVYIPLGGNRRGKMRTLCNVMIVMLLSGLWHGAAWTFVLWGFLHGVGMIWDNLEHPHLPKKWMRQAATFAYVCMTFVFFRAESIAQGIDVLKSIVSLKWNGFVFQMASALDMTECYMITKALSMKLPGLLSWFWLGIFVVLIAICFRVLSGEKVSGVVALQRQKGYGRLYPVLLAVLFTWSMISMTGVSEYLYFSF